MIPPFSTHVHAWGTKIKRALQQKGLYEHILDRDLSEKLTPIISNKLPAYISNIMGAKTQRDMLAFIISYDEPSTRLRDVVNQQDDLLKNYKPSIAYGIIMDNLLKALPENAEEQLYAMAYDLFTDIFPASMQTAVCNPTWKNRRPTENESRTLNELYKKCKDKTSDPTHNKIVTVSYTHLTLPTKA